MVLLVTVVNKKKITILGVTGSVGQSTMDVVLASPELFDVQAVTANKNVELLAASAIKLGAKSAIIADKSLEGDLQELLKNNDISVASGARAIEDAAAQDNDLIMAAIMAFAGLVPIIRALEQGTNVAIANKEPLVAAGAQIMALARETGAKILPVDSEHNAIFQVFEESNRAAIDKIILTASGGPFLNWNTDDIESATPEQACKHPNWVMGKKISVDSASMMNKALEIIEAHYLFDMPADKIEVLIHPQSIIHSMVAYCDGSVLSQMGPSDMRVPIASALGWPDRIESGVDKLDFSKLSQLDFKSPDFDKFPALRYAYKCLELGQGACVVLNAANEIAVAAFLGGKIKFGDIMKLIAYAIDEFYPTISSSSLITIEDVEELDNNTRLAIQNRINDRFL